MGRGLISGLIWGLIFAVVVLLAVSLLAPVERGDAGDEALSRLDPLPRGDLPAPEMPVDLPEIDGAHVPDFTPAADPGGPQFEAPIFEWVGDAVAASDPQGTPAASNAPADAVPADEPEIDFPAAPAAPTPEETSPEDAAPEEAATDERRSEEAGPEGTIPEAPASEEDESVAEVTAEAAPEASILLPELGAGPDEANGAVLPPAGLDLMPEAALPLPIDPAAPESGPDGEAGQSPATPEAAIAPAEPMAPMPQAEADGFSTALVTPEDGFEAPPLALESSEIGPDGLPPVIADIVEAPELDAPEPTPEPVAPESAADESQDVAPDSGPASVEEPALDPGEPSAPPLPSTQDDDAPGEEVLPELEFAIEPPAPLAVPALVRNAAPFENPQGQPLFAIVLLDDGIDPEERATLSRLPFPVTFVIDPTLPDAAEAAETFRAGGKEVMALARALPSMDDPETMAAVVAGVMAAVPGSVGLMDLPQGGFQGDASRSDSIIAALAADGHGLLTFERPDNVAHQIAVEVGLAARTMYRQIDDTAAFEVSVAQNLDRALFRAGQVGSVIVLGSAQAEGLAGLLEWQMEGRAAPVALAPVSAVLLARR